MNIYTEKNVQDNITQARPFCLATLALRMGRHLPAFRYAFLVLIRNVEAKNFSERFLEALDAYKYPLTMFELILSLVCRFTPSCVYRYMLNRVLIPYFIVENDEKLRDIIKSVSLEKKCTYTISVVGEETRDEKTAHEYLTSIIHYMRRYGGRVAVKPSSLISRDVFLKHTYQENKECLVEIFKVLLEEAEKYDTDIFFDAEEYYTWCHLVEDAFLETISSEGFNSLGIVVGIALQAYRRDVMESAVKILRVAEEIKTPVGLRIVKGAYDEVEKIEAKEKERDFPLFSHQSQTDEMFDFLVSYFWGHHEHLYLIVATHNAKNIAHALTVFDSTSKYFTFEVLNGMGESIRRALRTMGVPVSVYLPVVRLNGDIRDALAYLARRFEEVWKTKLVKNI